MRDGAPGVRLGVAAAMVVGLLLQLLLLPAGVFPEPTDPLWALGNICHAFPDEDGGAPQQPATHDHAHCPLCQSGTVAFLLPEQAPVLRELAVSLIRRSMPVLAAPEGMLRLAYASRAPPVAA